MTIADKLLNWYDQNGRTNLPWRQEITPYKVWISEIMLQQTQVNTVIPYYHRFMNRFPDVFALAEASEDELMHYWSGLGYYTRARNLHRAARIIVSNHHGQFPDNENQILELPGIGRSTAGAILAIAFNQPYPILDGNVKRVLTRLHAIKGWAGQAQVAKHLWQYAEQHTPTSRVDDYTQAIMDLGATICLKRQPSCLLCPLQSDCKAYKENLTEKLPEPKPKRTLPIKAQYFLILRNAQGALLLEKRPPAGLWGGLWCFPHCDVKKDWKTTITNKYGLWIKNYEEKPVVNHTFSHYKLQCHPVIIEVGKTAEGIEDASQHMWYHLGSNRAIGLPKLMNRLLEMLRSK